MMLWDKLRNRIKNEFMGLIWVSEKPIAFQSTVDKAAGVFN